MHFKGTVIIARAKNDRLNEVKRFMLIESMDANYFFQLVCISGYYAGNIYGYIRKDPAAIEANCIAITSDFLLDQMIYNLGELDMSVYEVIKTQSPNHLCDCNRRDAMNAN